MPSAPCSRSCARRRWPTTSTRKWSKEKILTQYLNAVYFGNGAYGVEAAARTYFGDDDTRAAAAAPAASAPQADAPRGGAAGGHHRLAERLRPDRAPHRRLRAAQPRAAADARAGPHHQARGVQRPPRGAAVARGHQAARRARRRPTYYDLGAPAARRPLRRRRAFEGGLRVKTTLDLELQEAAEKAVQPHLANPGGPGRRDRRDRQRHGRGPRDGRRTRLQRAAVQPRHPGPAPARLGLQAVHPRHRAAARDRAPARVWPSRKREFDVPGGRDKFVVNNYEGQLRRGHHAGRTPPDLRQLRLRRGRPEGRHAQGGAAGATDGDPHAGLHQPGDDARRPAEGVTPLEMAHAYATFAEPRAARVRHARPAKTGPVGIEREQGRQDGDETPQATAHACSCPRVATTRGDHRTW